MDGLIVGFAGPLASGKTTLSLRLAEILGWRRTSFGDWVRAVALSKGLVGSRTDLQRLGEQLVQGDLRSFCEGVLSQGDWEPGSHLIIDGFRHVEVLATMKELVRPAQVLLVFVDIDGPEQRRRIEGRGEPYPIDLAELESHSTERQVRGAMRSAAQKVVDGHRPIEELAIELVGWIKEL